MTNPNNIVRVRARNGGRASVYEANAWAQGFSMGILEGYGVTQNTSADMNVLVGGSATKPDVLIAQNPAGYKIALDIIGRQAVAITAPASNSRISAIVAYTNDLSLSTTQDDVTGSPASCGLIVVNGTAAANPVAPTDSQIRTAITSDGATGSQAAYCVIATIKVASNTTLITNSLISTNQAAIGSKNIDYATMKFPFIGDEIQFIGSITSSRNMTFTENCFVTGKACVFEDGAAAFCRIGGGEGRLVAGIPIMNGSTNAQVGFAIPVASGQSLYFDITGDAAFQTVSTHKMVVA